MSILTWEVCQYVIIISQKNSAMPASAVRLKIVGAAVARLLGGGPRLAAGSPRDVPPRWHACRPAYTAEAMTKPERYCANSHRM